MEIVKKIEKNGNFKCTIKGTNIIHCEDGPAEKYGSDENWYKAGQLHRIGGPALTSGGYQEWWVNGQLHRLDGPATEDGAYKRHYVLGEFYSPAKFKKLLQNTELVKQIRAFTGEDADGSPPPEAPKPTAKKSAEKKSVMPVLGAAAMLAGAGLVWAQKKNQTVGKTKIETVKLHDAVLATQPVKQEMDFQL